MAFPLKKVLISDEVDNKCLQILTDNGIEAVKKTKLTTEELLEEIKGYDGLIVRSATRVTEEVILAGRKLKIIGRAGTGVDNIDCNAATKHGVIVMNTPGGNTLSAAEHTCTLLLAMTRFVSNGTESLRAGRWDRKMFMGNEVYGKTLAIVGLGRIGKEVATRMQAFGMKTIGYDPILPAEAAAEFNVEAMSLEKLWPLADYITVHTPLIPQTKNLINDDVFKVCKQGVRLINCARGGIIDEEALLRALKSGKCAGAGLDVFVEEPPTNLELVRHPLVTSTPHLGANTVEAQSRVAEDIARQFVDLTNGTTLFGAINAHALTNALSIETRPWVALGTGLGTVMARLLGTLSSETRVEVTTQGKSLKSAGSYLSAAALVGLLKSQHSNGLNLVSAPAYAKELGITVKTRHEDKTPAGVSCQVTVCVQDGDGPTQRVTGLVGAGQPLLMSVNGAEFSQGATLSGSLLLYKSEDNFQVFANVADVLGKQNVTIQAFSRSCAVMNETWNVLQVSPSIASTEPLKSICTSICKLELCR